MPLSPKNNYDLVVDRDRVKEGISRISLEINEWHAKENFDKPVIALCMLNGGVFLFSDILLKFNFNLETEFFKITTYDIHTNAKLEGGSAPDAIINFDLEDRVVLIIDDICDTGNTLNAMVKKMYDTGARIVKTVVLIDRSHVFSSPITPDFAALKIDIKDWLVGMGLDDQNLYRNLDQVYRILK